MSKEIEFKQVGKKLLDGVDKTNKKAIPFVTSEQLKDTSKYVPISPTGKGRIHGTLRNSGVITTEINKGILKWSTSYAIYMWKHKGKFNEPTAKRKWAEVSFEKNIKKYKKMYTSIFNNNKLG